MARYLAGPAVPDTWRAYANLAQVKAITVSQGIELLVRNWPEGTNDSPADIRKRLRERITSAVKDRKLEVKGSGLTARVHPDDFFRWAVAWTDGRSSHSVENPMQAAALQFGAPNLAYVSAELPSLSCQARSLQVPRDFDEAKALAAEYQNKYLDALTEIERLQGQIAALKPDADAYQELMAKWKKKKQRPGSPFSD